MALLCLSVLVFLHLHAVHVGFIIVILQLLGLLQLHRCGRQARARCKPTE